MSLSLLAEKKLIQFKVVNRPLPPTKHMLQFFFPAREGILKRSCKNKTENLDKIRQNRGKNHSQEGKKLTVCAQVHVPIVGLDGLQCWLKEGA